MTQGTALITGASSGIGAIYADRLAHRGYDLILVARDVARLEALAERLRGEAGVQVKVLPADLSDPTQVAKVEQAITAEDRLTLLVNNAGISVKGALDEAPRENLQQILAVNVVAPTLLAAAAVRGFRARGRGRVINISSVLALAPELFGGVYSGTKAYILNLSQGLLREIGDSGVRVQAVLPGATRTEIWKRSGKDASTVPTDWMMEVDDLVDAALLGFDRGETVTIPPLQDETQWVAMQAARMAMAPHLSKREVAPRYRMDVCVAPAAE